MGRQMASDLDDEAAGEILSPAMRKALAEASDFVIDECFQDIHDLEVDVDGRYDFASLNMADHLPARYLPRYTPLFARQFLACLITVAWKLAHPDPYPLACVAEELACNAILVELERRVADEGLELDTSVNDLYDLLFEDLDFEYLFIPARDGIEEGEVGRYLGIGSLAFEAWFRPFGGGSRGPVHPYCAGEDDRPY